MAGTTDDCDDDDIGLLMPNVMKLLQAELDSEGSEGSTSMSISSEGEKEKHPVQNERPMITHEATSKGQPQGETLIQEVAKRFRREGVNGRGCLTLSKPLDLAPFRFYASPRRPGTSQFRPSSISKKNEMVTAPSATNRGTRLTLEEKMAMKQRPQPKSSKDLAQGTLRTKLKLKHSLAANSKAKAGRTTLPKRSLSGHGYDKNGHLQSLAGARPWTRPKICSKPTPIDLSELQKTFAQIDEESLEEEQESSVHERLQYSTAVTQMAAYEANVNEEEKTSGKVCSGIQGDLKEASENPQNKVPELPGFSQALKEPAISSGKAILRKTDRNASSNPLKTGSEERSVLEESNSNTNPDSETENGSEEHQSRPNHVEVLQSDGEQTLYEYDGKSRDVGMNENVEVSLNNKIGVGPNTGKRIYFRDSAGLVITCEEVSLSQCSGKMGAPKLLVTTTSKMESLPALLPWVPLAEQFGMASDTEPRNQMTRLLLKEQSRRVSVNQTPQKRLSLSEAENLSATNNPPERTCSTPSPQDFNHCPSTSGKEVQASKKRHANAREQGISGNDSALKKDTQHIHHCQPLQKNHPTEETMAVSNAQEGTYDVDMESSSSPPLNSLSNVGHRYRRKCIETSQRRLAFVSDSSRSDKDDGLKNSPVHGFGNKFASDQLAEKRKDLGDSLIGQDEDNRVDINNPAQVSGEHRDTVEGTNVGAGSGGNMVNASLDEMSCPGTQWNNTLSSIEEALVKPTPVEQQNSLTAHIVDGKENCDSRPVDELRNENRKKRAKTANLGSPMDAGTRWSEGRRISTRIKSKPLDWWRGEKMMYGRVHSTLCTLIGIKTMSPDPIWPKPKPNRGDNKVHKFYIDSFVDDKYTDLLRLAAQ